MQQQLLDSPESRTVPPACAAASAIHVYLFTFSRTAKIMVTRMKSSVPMVSSRTVLVFANLS